MLTANIHQLVIDCFDLTVFLVFLLLAAAVVFVVTLITLTILFLIIYLKKRKMASRHQNKVLTVSIHFFGLYNC